MKNFVARCQGLALLVGLFAVQYAKAECIQFDLGGSVPDARRITHFHPAASGFMSQIWCYEQVSSRESFVYLWDQQGPQAELSALVETDSNGKILEVAHGSLFKGDLSYVRSPYPGFSPFPVPLDLETARQLGQAMPSIAAENEMTEAKQEIIFNLRNAERQVSTLEALVAGTSKVNLPAEKLPYGAYWWPYRGLPILGPLKKYDRIVASWSGIDPRSVDWESANHGHDVDWGGHCNGWAASALLYKEIAKPLFHAETNTTLTNSDFNGMLAESNYCVNYSFYGRRYNGNQGDVLEDIAPDLFHRVLTYFIKTARKAVILDVHADASVDNHVATGYTMNVVKDALDSRLFHISVKLRMHTYDMSINQALGPASQYTRQYDYDLRTDAAGEIISGTWKSENPDFMWVANSNVRCGWENPRIYQQYINQMLRLPVANGRR